MIRVFLRSLAILAFWAGLAAAPSYAQNAEQKGAEPGKGEAAKEGVRRSDDALECSRLGGRAVYQMRSDDLDTAFKYLDLYDRFGCPGEHIRISFRCVLQREKDQKDQKDQKDPKDQKDQKDAKDQKDQKATDYVQKLVEACWNDPASPVLPPGQASASAAEKSGTK